jgi:hypothetical protein
MLFWHTPSALANVVLQAWVSHVAQGADVSSQPLVMLPSQLKVSASHVMLQAPLVHVAPTTLLVPSRVAQSLPHEPQLPVLLLRSTCSKALNLSEVFR